MSDDPVAPIPGASDPWGVLRDLTPARVALGRSGVSLPTAEVLRFGHAHALARDAVHTPLDTGSLRAELAALGLQSIALTSAAVDRAEYLRRPDRGRSLTAEGVAALQPFGTTGFDLSVVVADGLSATAVHINASKLIEALLPAIKANSWSLAPVVIATQARVALGDDIGAALQARMVLMLIGERPGLSAADSLGVYMTFAPHTGRRDNERNCVSNIRDAGLSPARAARSIVWLVAEAFRRGATGVALKDDSVDQSSIVASAAPEIGRS